MVDHDRDQKAEIHVRAAVMQRFEVGRAAWPEVALPFEAFERYFAAHATASTFPDEAHAADMYLACACSHGIDAALAVLERTLVGDVARAVASIDASHAFVEETLQATRERLLVRKGPGPSKIADYAGRASLRSWLRAVAVRRAVTECRRRSERHHEPLTAHDDVRLARDGPDFEYLRRRYKTVFEGAVRAAIDDLPPKQRLLLRLNMVEGMSVDKLAAIYKVGRSTAARWLASARRALLEQVRSDLCAKLGVTPTELDSLGGDVRSHLEVSIARLLARTSEGESTK
jgi:RNA polymerase sigma-70 factor, ECF subfamily